MNRARLYSNVLVKIGVERSFLLSEEKLRGLARCKSLAEFASELKDTTYSKTVANVSQPYSVRKFERAFREELIETICKIVENSPEVICDFLKVYLLKFEIENIKTILRAASIGLSFGEIKNRTYLQVEDFLKRREIFMKAVTAINVRSVVDALKNTEYEPLLTVGLKRYEETGSIQPFELLLDKMFYEKLGNAFKDLPKKEQEHALFYVSLENDGFNLRTILRAKNLGYDPHWIRMAISRYSFKVPEEVVEKLVMAEDFESALKIVQQTYYGRFFVQGKTPEEILSMAEKAFRRAVFIHAKKTRVGDLFNVSVVLGFLTQKEVEVRNLTVISLGIEYGWKPDDSLAMLLL